MARKIFKIGTRDSPLAMRQAKILAGLLGEAHQGVDIQIVPIRSKADWKKSEGEKPLSEEAGGKGLFAKEIEQALLRGEVDCGVHSLKDMASELPKGLSINHVLERANPQDALICNNYSSIDVLPQGAVLGTCSTRRAAIALHLRPDLKIMPFRGNVQTRIDKISNAQVDATFLAMAGIERLGIQNDMIHPVSIENMLPACGQGVICMESRVGDRSANSVLDAVNHSPTALCVKAEREVLRVLDGTCHTPISAYATLEAQTLSLKVQIYSLDGQHKYEAEQVVSNVTSDTAKQCGAEVGQKLLHEMPEGFLA